MLLYGTVTWKHLSIALVVLAGLTCLFSVIKEDTWGTVACGGCAIYFGLKVGTIQRMAVVRAASA